MNTTFNQPFMKYALSSLLFLMIYFSSIAQDIIYDAPYHDIITPHGTGSFGAGNSSFFHFHTGMPGFYFGKKIAVNGEINAYQRDLVLQTDNDTRMVIKDGTGKVGIGTTVPGFYNLAANFTTFNSLLDVDGEVLAREGLRVVGPGTIGNGQAFSFNLFSASIHQNSRGTVAPTGWVAKVHSSAFDDPLKLSFFDGYSSAYNANNNALLDNLDSNPVLTLEASYNRVGIGTDSPTEKLHVNGNIMMEGTLRGNEQGGAVQISTEHGHIDLGPRNASFAHFYTDMPGFFFNKRVVIDGPISSYDENDLILETDKTTRVTISNATGNVGIGTETPLGRLDIQRPGTLGGLYDAESSVLRVGYGNIQMIMDGNELYSNHNFSIGTSYNHDISFRNVDATQHEHLMTIKSSGNVGIGTTAPTQKLSVDGKINAEEIILEDVSGADFVFEEDYDLRSLAETEQFIKANKHLPEIPSAAEMAKEGLEIKEMNILLLQKVEELTLHLIRQEKEMQEMQQEIQSLKTSQDN